MTAKLSTPGKIVAVDLDDSRLAKALEFGADNLINNGREDARARIRETAEPAMVGNYGLPATSPAWALGTRPVAGRLPLAASNSPRRGVRHRLDADLHPTYAAPIWIPRGAVATSVCETRPDRLSDGKRG